ncbi:MAG: hypothetical protein LBE98_01815 [Puniceicoccales bacterium]|jgi:hypothetical protein|nr:hypothetical protein [Puniceicoccales bacterium]
MGNVNNKMDEASSDGNLREKMCCFFKKHSQGVYLGLGATICVVLAIVLVWFISGFASECSSKEICDYTNLTDNSSKEKFIKKHVHWQGYGSKYGKSCGNHPLAGLVLLDLGDSSFAKNNFKLASLLYSWAAKAFPVKSSNKTDFPHHGRILEALSLFNLGEREKCFAILDEIGHNEMIGKHFRAEALYRYLCCAKESDEVAKINEIFSYFKDANMPINWLQRIEAESFYSEN